MPGVRHLVNDFPLSFINKVLVPNSGWKVKRSVIEKQTSQMPDSSWTSDWGCIPGHLIGDALGKSSSHVLDASGRFNSDVPDASGLSNSSVPYVSMTTGSWCLWENHILYYGSLHREMPIHKLLV